MVLTYGIIHNKRMDENNLVFSYFFLLQTELIYPNGFKILAKKMDMLNSISTEPDCDRRFINSAFLIFFPEGRIRKQIKKGLNREGVLEKFRESSKYALMSSIYEYRVLSNGSGDTKARILIFTKVFRVKLNNWWKNNLPKEKK